MSRKYKSESMRKGYTLIEVVLTLVIAVILLGVAGGGLIAWQNYAHFKKNNEYAQTIFTAAQSGFTHAQASGTLTELEEELESSRYSNSLTGSMIKNGENISADATGMYYLIYEKDRDLSTLPEAYQMVYEMLESYVYDASILDAAFCVEFDPADGIILGVCYNDRADSFVYNGGSSESTVNGRTVNDICDRDPELRREILLGFYGAEDMSGQAPGSLGKPVINNFQLVNEETLHLKWQLSSKYRNISNELAYTIRLYDADSKTLLCSLKVNDADASRLKAESMGTSRGESELRVTCDVTLYDETDSGNTTVLQDVAFKAYATNQSVMYLVLDAVDLEAAEATDAITTSSQAIYEEYKDTFSIARLNLGARNLYARIQATGDRYKSSAWKQTNTENALFDEAETAKQGTDETTTYTVANARHLFNVRFTEKGLDQSETGSSSKKKTIIYEQTSDFTWSGSGGILEHGNVFDEEEQISTASFPTIGELTEDHTYQSTEGNRIYQIQGLTLEGETSLTGSTGSGRTPTGLFRTNSGTISRVILNNVEVTGENYVGTFCGVNAGTLQQLQVTGESSVSGADYVGGIAGSDVTGQTENGVMRTGSVRTYEELTNAAEVSGENYVGGIVSYIYGIYDRTSGSQTTTETLAITDSSNTGYVHGTGSCIGGVTGYNRQTELNGCVSTPTLPEAVENQINNNGDMSSLLVGENVGGIVGLNIDGTLENCSTGSDYSQGYVLGDRYVGGIVGRNAVTVTTAILLDGNGASNRNHVIGNEFVGGIVGSNQSFTVSGSDASPGNVQESAENCEISNWTNTGRVAARENYAGGITGYNAGTVRNCRSVVDVNTVSGEELLAEAEAWGGTGSYVGGLVGYNGGSVASDNSQRVVSVVAGQDYVGGIVGFNSISGTITGYSITGAYVSGDAFVGGFVGLNRSDSLFENEQTVNPNRIEGRLYVGGAVGGNITNTPEGNWNCNINNSLGSVSGTAFVGGYIGYNKIVPVSYNETECAALAEISRNGQGLADLAASVQAYDSTASATSGTLQIGTSDIVRYNRLSNISGSIYVGGVLGYNAGVTPVVILSIVNESRVSASASITGNEGYQYSYVGGITGVVSSNMELRNCENASSAAISSHGDFLGGLAEENNGQVISCRANSIGSSTRDKVGGLIGVNRSSIRTSTVSGTVTGRNEVGGIAAWNRGSIIGCQINGSIRSYGDYAGGVTGHNYAGGIVSGNTLNVSILADGNYVGGFIGLNEAGFGADNTMAAGLTIQGNQYVGGFIGEQRNADLSGLRNYARIIATNGHAGGIVGKAAGNITDCDNYGTVTAERSGNAGGITAALETATISECESYGAVTASGGEAGGIVSTIAQGGTVRDCEVGSSSDPVTIMARDRIGGIASDNSGTIADVKIESVTLSAAARSTTPQMGGIVGRNLAAGTLRNCAVGTSASPLSLEVGRDGGSYGGAAGLNLGTIEGTGTSKVQVYADLQATDTLAYANIGGVTGINAGTLSGYSFIGSVSGNGGSSYGYGGIAGANRGTIRQCELTNGVIIAQGTSSEVANIGGIAGRNEATAVITECTLAEGRVMTAKSLSDANAINVTTSGVTSNTNRLNSGNAWSGGAVGYNNGTLDNCKAQQDKRMFVAINLGDIGGMVGYNDVSGSVAFCETGELWTVYQSNHGTDNSAGGIIGYNRSVRDLTQNINRAYVHKTRSSTATGGIVGRQETQASQNWKIDGCLNYARIQGSQCVGGMVGRWKYNGGTIVNSINYGEIRGSGSIVGGLIGDTYSLSSGANIQVTSCRNEGTIYGSGAAGGILGQNASSGSATQIVMQIYDCVNTGTIRSGGDCAGIVGAARERGVTLTIEKCRNYGFPSSGTSFSGILGTRSSETVNITDCFGVADVQYPITNASSGVTIENSYYFGQGAASSDDEIELRTYSVWSTGTTTEDATHKFENACDGNADTYASFQNGTGLGTIEMIFSEEQSLHTLDVQWYAGGQRTYTYNVYYQDAGKDWKMAAENVEGTITGATDKTVRGTVISSELEGVKATGIRIEITKNDSPRYIAFREIKINEKSPSITNTILTAKGRGTILGVRQDKDGTYYAQEEWTTILTGLPSNPLQLNTPYTAGGTEWETTWTGIDERLRAHYTGGAVNKLETPTDLKAESAGSAYTISWTRDPLAYGYQVQIDIYNDENGTDAYAQKNYLVGIGNSLNLDVEDDWSGKYLRVTLTALASADPQDANNSEPAYYPTVDTTLPINAFLPTPQVHLEFMDNGRYRAVLDNWAEYDGLSADIVITANSARYRFDAANKQAELTYTGQNTNSSYSYSAEAKGETANTYGNSRTVSLQSAALPRDYLKETATSAWNEGGYTGITPDTLSYAVRLNNKSQEIYYRAELLTEDADLENIQVAVSSAEARVYSTDSSTTPVQMELTNLPTGISSIDGVQVRCYPSYSQNEFACYTYEVWTGTDQTELLNTYTTVSGTTRSVNAGYTIEKLADGSYKVYYSPLLKDSAYGVQVLKEDVDKVTAQPTPVIEPITLDANDNYTFTWDKDSSTGSYAVVITGQNVETGEEAELYTTDQTTDHSVTLAGANWQYNKLKIEVTRLGEVSTAGYTITSGTKAELEQDIKVRLDTPENVNYNLAGQSELIYQVTWTPISLNDNYRNEFGAYDIYLNDGSGDALVGSVADITAGTFDIDLDAYQGKECTVYVVSRAADGAATYRNSRASDQVTRTIQQRMDKPDVTGLALDKTATDIMSVKAFVEDGVILTMISDRIDSGTYVMTASVYDTNAPGEGTAPLWQLNGGNPVGMNGELQNASYTVKGIPADYAGYYLCVQIRAADPSSISSYWSDKAYFQLPKVRTDNPDLAEGTVLETVREDQKSLNSTDTDHIDKNILQDSLSWSPITFVNEYEAVITPSVSADDITASGDKIELKIQTNDDGSVAKVLEKTEETDITGNPLWKDYINPQEITEEDPLAWYTTWSYVLDDKQTYTGSTDTYEFEMELRMSLDVIRRTDKSNGEVTYIYRLRLPDVTSDADNNLDQVYERALRYTTNVQVKAVPKDSIRYTESWPIEWKREIERDALGSDVYVTKIEVLDETN